MCLLTHAEGVSTRRHRRPSREHVPVRFWGLPLSVEQLSSAAKVTGTLDGAPRCPIGTGSSMMLRISE
jgi:hypothetical protein